MKDQGERTRAAKHLGMLGHHVRALIDGLQVGREAFRQKEMRGNKCKLVIYDSI